MYRTVLRSTRTGRVWRSRLASPRVDGLVPLDPVDTRRSRVALNRLRQSFILGRVYLTPLASLLASRRRTGYDTVTQKFCEAFS